MVADTCISMDQWVQNPTAHTALDDILPCVDNATAQETLIRSKEVTSQLVGLVNLVIGNIANANVPPSTPPPLYFNQSGPSVPNLCNPFNSNLTDRTCMSAEVDFTNATQVIIHDFMRYLVVIIHDFTRYLVVIILDFMRYLFSSYIFWKKYV